MIFMTLSHFLCGCNLETGLAGIGLNYKAVLAAVVSGAQTEI